MTKRNLVTCVLLTILTCGIYPFFWMYGMYSDINRELKENNSAGVDILLMFLTCGIWTIWCIYKYSKKVGEITGEDNSLICLICMLFSAGLISYCIMQNQINNYIDKTIPYEK